MPHNIMQQMEVMSASPYHTVSRIEVMISNDPQDREIYKTGRTKQGNKWVDLYGVSKVGLDRLMIASGMTEKDSVSQREGERVWWAKWRGEYTQPDGTVIPLEDEKQIDLRVGGTRWQGRVDKELDNLLKGTAGSLGVKREEREAFADFLLRVMFVLKKKDHERFEELQEMAEAKATRFVNKAAQFGLELAKTGARLRAVRTVMEIKTYTARDLAEPFIVVRSRYDWEKLQAALPEHGKQMLVAALIGKATGMGQEAAMKMLSAPESTMPNGIVEEPAMEFEDLDGVVVETKEDLVDFVVEEMGGVVSEPVEETSSTDKAFDMPVTNLETMNWIEANVENAKFPHLRGLLGYLMGQTMAITDLTQGEAHNVRRFMEGIMMTLGNTDDRPVKLAVEKEKLKAILVRCNAEKSFWSDKEQLELPE